MVRRPFTVFGGSRWIVPPNGTIEFAVVQEASALLGLDDVSTDDNLWSLGLDSRDAIEMCERLITVFGSRLRVSDFVGASTPSEIAGVLARGRFNLRPYAVTLVESDEQPSIFMMTGAGSCAFRFQEVADGVANGHGVIAYEQYGLMQRWRRPDRTIPAAASRNVAHVLECAPSSRLVLVGHSWGGVVAHEMACQLKKLGHDVVLVLIDTGRPGYEAGVDESEVQHTPWTRTRPRRAARAIYRMLRRQMWRLSARRRLDNRFWLFYDYGIRATREHRPQVFDGPMLVVQVEGSRAGETWRDHPQLRVVTTRGNHNSLCHAPHVYEVNDVINAFLASLG